MLTAAFLGVGVSLVSLSYYSAGVWIRPWQADFGWSRAEIGGAQTISTLVLIMTAPLAGLVIDRFGLVLNRGWDDFELILNECITMLFQSCL